MRPETDDPGQGPGDGGVGSPASAPNLQRRHAQHLAPAQQKTTRPMTLVMSGTGEHGAGKV